MIGPGAVALADRRTHLLESGFEPNSPHDDHLAGSRGDETEIWVDWFERAQEPEA